MYKDSMTIEFILIRHGKTRSNEEGRYLGWTDEELSEQGIAEMNQRKQVNPMDSSETKKGMDLQGSLLFVSPMLRCKQTAEILFPGQQGIVIEDFKEMNFGEFEGKNYAELNGNPSYQAWIDSNGRGQIPDGESFDEYVKRVFRGFMHCIYICHAYAEKKHRVECVSSGMSDSLISDFREDCADNNAAESPTDCVDSIVAESPTDYADNNVAESPMDYADNNVTETHTDYRGSNVEELRTDDRMVENRDGDIKIELRDAVKIDASMEHVKEDEEPDLYVSAVVHGGTIMAILSELTGRDYYDFQVKNGEGYRMRLEVSVKEA